MSVNHVNEIISVFLQRNVNEISDKDLCAAIDKPNGRCSIEQIHRSVETNGSSLFAIRCNTEGTPIVHLEPKVMPLFYFSCCDLMYILDQYMYKIS